MFTKRSIICTLLALAFASFGATAQPVVGGSISLRTPAGGIALGIDTGNTGSPIAHYNFGEFEALGTQGFHAPSSPLAGIVPSDEDQDGYPSDLESNLTSNPNDPESTPLDRDGDGRVDYHAGAILDSNGNGRNDLFELDADNDGFYDDVEANLASNPNDRESTPVDPNGDDQPL